MFSTLCPESETQLHLPPVCTSVVVVTTIWRVLLLFFIQDPINMDGLTLLIFLPVSKVLGSQRGTPRRPVFNSYSFFIAVLEDQTWALVLGRQVMYLWAKPLTRDSMDVQCLCLSPKVPEELWKSTCRFQSSDLVWHSSEVEFISSMYNVKGPNIVWVSSFHLPSSLLNCYIPKLVCNIHSLISKVQLSKHQSPAITIHLAILVNMSYKDFPTHSGLFHFFLEPTPAKASATSV